MCLYETQRPLYQTKDHLYREKRGFYLTNPSLSLFLSFVLETTLSIYQVKRNKFSFWIASNFTSYIEFTPSSPFFIVEVEL